MGVCLSGLQEKRRPIVERLFIPPASSHRVRNGEINVTGIHRPNSRSAEPSVDGGSRIDSDGAYEIQVQVLGRKQNPRIAIRDPERGCRSMVGRA